MEDMEQELKGIVQAAGYNYETYRRLHEQALDYGNSREYDDEEHIRQDFETSWRHKNETN